MTPKACFVISATLAATMAALALASSAYAIPVAVTMGNSGAPSTPSGPISYVATQTSELTLTFSSGFAITCAANTGSTLGGTLSPSSSGVFGAVNSSKFGTATWNGAATVPGTKPCLGGGTPVSVQHIGSWPITAGGASTPQSAGTSPTASQITPLTITNIKLTMHLGSCTFTIGGPTAGSSGWVVGHYTNSAPTGKLTVFSTSATALKVADAPAAGCGSAAISNGSTVKVTTSTYGVNALSPATNAIWVRA